MASAAADASPASVNRLIERRLAEFVDRDGEMAQFGAVLDAEDTPIMCVFGETGMGKTSLLLRMVHECAVRKLRKAEVVWNDTSPHDYMAVMRKVRDDFGIEHFRPFTDLINYYTDTAYKPQLEITLKLPGQTRIEVGSGMNLESSTVGDIAGLIIRDNMFVVPRADLGIPEAMRREELTLRFLDGLKKTAASGLLVVFFDSIEKMSADTCAWMWDQLLNPMRAGQLNHVRFVLCGQTRPPADRDWEIFIQSAELKPLEAADVVAYLAKRAPVLASDVQTELARFIHATTQGRPTDVAAAVDLYLKSRKA